MAAIKHDMHIHTIASKCCHDKHQTLDNIIAHAKELKLERIGFTDHVWEKPGSDPQGFYIGQTGSNCLELKQSARRFQDDDIDVLVGCEAETIAPGQFSISEDFAAQLDYVILATNHFHITNLVAQPTDYRPETFARHIIEMFLSGIRCPFVDIIAHPFIPLGHFDKFEAIIAAISDRTFSEIFAETAASGTAVEITTNYLNKPELNRIFSRQIPIRILSLARAADCKFVFSSDAHKLTAMDRIFDLQYLAEEAGIGDDDIHPLAATGSKN